MNTRPLPASVLAVLAAALIGAAVPMPRAFAAQGPTTDAKIRLMSEALRARDAGDLAGARKALDQLTSLSPSDPAVQSSARKSRPRPSPSRPLSRNARLLAKPPKPPPRRLPPP
jgi:hypothetical protein